MPSLLHEQLSEKLQNLEEPELKRVEESLNTLVKLLDIEKMEASPIITLNIDLEDIESHS